MSQSGFGKKGQRELVDVLEPKKPDRRFDKFAHVRKQRLQRYERERNETREKWREQRHQLNEKKLCWRKQLDDAHVFWQEQRNAFFQMTISSAKFRAAKFTYQKKLELAAQTHLEAREQAQRSRRAGEVFFAALTQVKSARLQQEKLDFFREDLLKQSLQDSQ